MELKITKTSGAPYYWLLVLQRAFALANRRLGLDGVRGKVELAILPGGEGPVQCCPGCGGFHAVVATMGETLPEVQQGPDGATTHVILYLNKQTTPETMLGTLFHELTHVGQMVAERLIALPNGCALWNRKYYRTVEGGDVADQHAYESQPWEKEARTRSAELMKEFLHDAENQVRRAA